MPNSSKFCSVCGASFTDDVLFCRNDGTPLGRAVGESGVDPYLGLVVDDGVQVLRFIGAGATGRVYEAKRVLSGELVAVKILHRELLADSTLVARFQREAHVCLRLSHPGLVATHAIGHLPGWQPDQEVGEPYIISELLFGETFREVLNREGSGLLLDRALRVLVAVCDAVGYAHRMGVVHRDLKPENVMMVGAEGEIVKVLDFGLARLFADGSRALTRQGQVLGTAAYMSPEASMGIPVGFPGDVYALATMTYEALVGRLPFGDAKGLALLLRQSQQPPPDLGRVADERGVTLPKELVSLVMENLSKVPSQRCADASSFGRALSQFIADR